MSQSFLSEVHRLQAGQSLPVCHTFAHARFKSHSSNTPAYRLTRVAIRYGGRSVFTVIAFSYFVIFTFYIHMSDLHACMHVNCVWVPVARRGQKRTFSLLKLQLEMVVNHAEGAGN